MDGKSVESYRSFQSVVLYTHKVITHFAPDFDHLNVMEPNLFHIQGSHSFQGIIFQDISRTFPGQFPGQFSHFSWTQDKECTNIWKCHHKLMKELDWQTKYFKAFFFPITNLKKSNLLNYDILWDQLYGWINLLLLQSLHELLNNKIFNIKMF